MSGRESGSRLNTNALVKAIQERSEADVLRLFHERARAWGGININTVIRQAALATAASRGYAEVVSLLLDLGADINAVGGSSKSTPLRRAISSGHAEVVSLLLDRGADINAVGGSSKSTPLGRAASSGHVEVVSLLLDRGADINAVWGSSKTTALAEAALLGHVEVVSLLLDRGANINAIGGSSKSTALGRAAFSGHLEVVTLLLDRGADINAVTGPYGTALATAASRGHAGVVSLLLDRGADIDAVGPVEWRGLTALAVAIKQGDIQITSLLLNRGADVNHVCGEFGTALGWAVHQGNEKLVALLLHRGADANHIGGVHRHRAALRVDGYPSAMSAVASAGMSRGSALVTLLTGAMVRQLTHDHGLVAPPFPMPYPGHVATPPSSNCYQLPIASDFSFCAGDFLAPKHADVVCRHLSERILVQSLIALVGIHAGSAEHLHTRIRTDIRYFVSQGFDFGLAYAAARVGWKHFDTQRTSDVKAQRCRWLGRAKAIHQWRTDVISKDNTGQELINSPYSIMPRRIWDLKSNRVVDFAMLQAEDQSMHEASIATIAALYPPFWAVSHSWTSDMEAVETPINQYQWSVPLPKGINLEHVREELLNFGAEYVWLDVLCLRQQPAAGPATQVLSQSSSPGALKQGEWKIDVPTIGNIYRAATHIVRYFNGLGRPFSRYRWDDDRHWLLRAWTLQEIRTENTTFNGGFSQSDGIIMNQEGTTSGGLITLRDAIRPVLKLAANVDSSTGCRVYELVREMSKRCASQPLDKLTGLFYLLRTTQLPTYDAAIDEEIAWRQCFHVLPFARKIEILFDFPTRGTVQQWFPTWRQIMEWPARDSRYEHASAEHPQTSTPPQLLHPVPDCPWLYVHYIWAISNVSVQKLSKPNEYKVRIGHTGMTVGFYYPYEFHDRAPIIASQKVFTLAIITPGPTYNWAVCEELETRNGDCIMSNGNVEAVKIHVLKKVGVLRTDSSGELLVRRRNTGPVVKRINVLFV